MRYLTLVLLLIQSFAAVSQSQLLKEELIILGTGYHNNFRQTDPDITKKVKGVQSPELQHAKRFIVQLLKGDKNILNREFISKPDSSTLHAVFIALNLNYNLFSEKPISADSVIKKFSDPRINPLEFLEAYYSMLFIDVQNQYLDLGKINFEMDELNLTSDEDRAIFFFVAMARFGLAYSHWPNSTFQETLARYPKFNGEPFYHYRDVEFKDFKIRVDVRRPKESFKDHYLERYLTVFNLLMMRYSDEIKQAQKKH